MHRKPRAHSECSAHLQGIMVFLVTGMLCVVVQHISRLVYYKHIFKLSTIISDLKKSKVPAFIYQPQSHSGYINSIFFLTKKLRFYSLTHSQTCTRYLLLTCILRIISGGGDTVWAKPNIVPKCFRNRHSGSNIWYSYLVLITQNN